MKLSALISGCIESWLTQHNLAVIYNIHSGGAVGDMFCLTAYMRSVHKQYGLQFIVITKLPELFLHNPIVRWNIPFNRLGFILKPIVKWFVRNIKGKHIMPYGYAADRRKTPEERISDHRRRVSLMQLHTEHMPFTIDYADVQNQMVFSDQEIADLPSKFNLPAAYAVIKPKGRTRWTPNKEWSVERFQDVVNLTPQILWVHCGEISDPPLSGVIDLRGKTSLRELCFLISRAKLVLSVEGFFNHAASAFATPSFVIFSGLSHPELAWYRNTIPITREPQVPCAPCWLNTACPVKGKPCTADITTQQVLKTVRTYFENLNVQSGLQCGLH